MRIRRKSAQLTVQEQKDLELDAAVDILVSYGISESIARDMVAENELAGRPLTWQEGYST